MLYVYAYNPGSRGASALAQGLGVRRIRHTGSTYRGRPQDTVINWGSASTPVWMDRVGGVLNPPSMVAQMSNKLSFFNMLGHIDELPPWTTDIEEARGWIQSGNAVVQRTILNGHSGNGIIIADQEAQLVACPLYVKYMKKSQEYRVHIFNHSVLTINRKARRNDVEEPNWRVRNHDNGFIYSRTDFDTPRAVTDLSHQVINRLDSTTRGNLDFGALDIIWNHRDNRAYALEINMAPGIEGVLVDQYVNAFNELME